MSAKQWCVHYSKMCCHTLKHFDDVFTKGIFQLWHTFTPLLFETRLQIISAMFQLNGLAVSDKMNCISDVMVMVLAFSVIDRGFKSWSSQAKDNKNDIYCFSGDYAALRSKNNKWLAQNQDNVSEWSNMSICGLLFQYTIQF